MKQQGSARISTTHRTSTEAAAITGDGGPVPTSSSSSSCTSSTSVTLPSAESRCSPPPFTATCTQISGFLVGFSALACSALSHSPVWAFGENPSSSRSSSRLVWSRLTSAVRRERSEKSSVDYAQTFWPPLPRKHRAAFLKSFIFVSILNTITSHPFLKCVFSSVSFLLGAQVTILATQIHPCP